MKRILGFVLFGLALSVALLSLAGCTQPAPEGCLGAGESAAVYPGNECCPRLDALSPADEETCQPLLGSFVCSDCGNGSCESWESRCNCPEDC